MSWNEDSREALLRTALPGEIDLPACDDEVHQLLRQFGFAVPRGHLDQAIDAHARGDWAAANSQIRSFLEGLVGDIAHRIEPQLRGQSPSAENCRALLAERGFLSKDRNEWTADGKNFLNGLFKMLHTDGSHPGLSDEDHSTFRLHLAFITARPAATAEQPELRGCRRNKFFVESCTVDEISAQKLSKFSGKRTD